MTTTSKNIPRLDALTAKSLLDIPADAPEYLFTGDASAQKTEYRYLVKLWHPDHSKSPQARDVFEHLVKLNDCAETRLADGTWQTPGRLTLVDKSGKKFELSYMKKAPFEFGNCYISRTLVTYVVRPEHKESYDHAVKAIRGIAYANDTLRKEFSHTLPQIEKAFEAQNGFVLIVKKDPELVRLRDLIDHAGGTIDPRHAAWIMSSLHNLACFLSTTELTHNDIGPDTYFVGPKAHTGVLLGGWWYALPEQAAISRLPDRTFDFAPEDILRDAKADKRLDLALIRLTGREMFGDPKGLTIHRNPAIPKPLSTWLRMPSSGNAIDDYKAWGTTLTDSFGARRYTELKTTFSDIYEKGEKPWASPHPSTSKPTARPAP